MRVLLIRAGHATLSYYNITYPMGLLYLAAAARRELGAEVRIVDARFPWNGPARVRHELSTFRPDVVGLSALTVEARSMHRLAAIVRRLAPDTLLVAGGPHATVFPEETRSVGSELDAVVVGEGELPFVQLLQRAAAGRDGRGINGVLWRGEAGPARWPEPENDLDHLPQPAWDLVDPRVYALWPSMAPVGPRLYRNLITSRGCPYRCIYCHRNHGKRFRAHSAERVIEEIERAVVERGIRDFEVLDDVFNLDRQRVVDIAEGILHRRLKVRLQFPNGVRSDLVDEELLGLLRRAGTEYLSFAIETASERLQRLLGKRLRIDRAQQAIATASRLGFVCVGFFMVGLPTETEEEALETLRFACSSELHAADFFRTVAHPGTELATRYAKQSDLPFAGGGAGSGNEARGDHDAPIDNTFRRYSLFHTDQNLSRIPDRRLAEFVPDAIRRFYTPRRLARLWQVHPRPWFLPVVGGLVFWRSFLARAARSAS